MKDFVSLLNLINKNKGGFPPFYFLNKFELYNIILNKYKGVVMKTFDDFKNMCGINEKRKRELYIKLYRLFIKLMDDIINKCFSDENKLSAILSYDREFRIQLNSNTRDTFFIILSCTPVNTFCISSFIINDKSRKHRDGNTVLFQSTMNDDDIEDFFKEYFDEFEEKVIVQPKQIIFDTLENSINEKIFKKQVLNLKENYKDIHWSYDKFINSVYAFKINKEIRDECDEIINKYYYDSADIRNSISKLK